MPRHPARLHPRDMTIDAVEDMLRAFLATNPPSPYEDADAFLLFGTDRVKLEGYDLSFFMSQMRRLVQVETLTDEDDREAVERELPLIFATHATTVEVTWPSLVAVAMFSVPELVDHAVRWRGETPAPADRPRPRRRSRSRQAA